MTITDWIQAFSTVALVAITWIYVWRINEGNQATKEMAEATKLMAKEQKDQNERERDIKAVVFFMQRSKGKRNEILPIKEVAGHVKISEERLQTLLPYLTGDSDPLFLWETQGVSHLRLRKPNEYIAS